MGANAKPPEFLRGHLEILAFVGFAHEIVVSPAGDEPFQAFIGGAELANADW